MRRLLLLLAVTAIALPVAANSVTKDQTGGYADAGVSIKMLTPAGSVYQQGESVAFNVVTDSDAYVLVFNIDTDGYVSLLYPRSARTLLGFAGGRTYAIPADMSQELLVTGKTGIEFVFAVSIKDRGAINDAELTAMLQDESQPLDRRFRVSGDPFLAANRIAGRLVSGIAYTRDESMAYTYFYIDEPVDYPRYLCLDCEGQGIDGFSDTQSWVATSAFDREDHLSYPLQQAFVRSDENVTLQPETVTETGEDPTPVYVYNTYNYNSYPYYPGYYRPYWGSAFYFSVGWNWGWGVGWRWGYPFWYYPWYGYTWCRPYAVAYGGYWGYRGHYRHGHGGPVAYRPTIRPRAGTRIKGGAGANYMPKSQTASRLRSKSLRYQRADKGAYGGTKLASSGVKSRPVYRFNPKPKVRAGGARGYQTSTLRSQSGVRHKTGKGYTTTRSSNRPVKTLKGQPTKRRSLPGAKTHVRGSSRATGRGTSGTAVKRSGSTRTRSGFSRPTTRRTTGSSRVKSTNPRSSRTRSGFNRPTTHRTTGSSRVTSTNPRSSSGRSSIAKPSRSRGSSSRAISRGGNRSVSRGGAAKARGGARSGGRRR
jgi:hypothetical protein